MKGEHEDEDTLVQSGDHLKELLLVDPTIDVVPNESEVSLTGLNPELDDSFLLHRNLNSILDPGSMDPRSNVNKFYHISSNSHKLHQIHQIPSNFSQLHQIRSIPINSSNSINIPSNSSNCI